MTTPAATRGYVSESQVAVVIAPPWLRTGTGRVVEDQIAYYRDRGFATAFIGVPVNAAHVPENPMWVELGDAARELRADHVSFAFLDHPPNPNTLRRRIRQSLAARTELDWIVEIGHCSRPSSALLDYLRNRRIALFHVNHVFTLGFVRRLRRQLGQFEGRLPILVETHDVQSEILHERNNCNPWTQRRDDRDSLVRAEMAHLAEADVLIHCSIDDQTFFSKLFPSKPQLLARPLIDGSFPAAVAAAQKIKPIDILFVGTGHHANSEAVEWFLTTVWPLIAKHKFSFRVVGGVVDLLGQSRPDLCHQFRECFIGRVPDLAPYYRAARCVIAPMRSGGGISIKTIEAFALGMPVVGTTKAFRGFPREPLARNGIQKHDDPFAFSQAILKAISNDDDTGRRGRAVYDELFSRKACYAVRDESVRIAQHLHANRANSGNAPARQTTARQYGDGSVTASSRMISVVLPLKISGCTEELARCDILLASLSRFAESGLFREFFIVVPSQEERFIRSVLGVSTNLPITVISETDILPQLRRNAAASGWWRQQLIKLAVATNFNTDFYLTLDADIVLCKPLSFDRLIVDGRALIEPEARTVHPSWWEGSAKLLGIPIESQNPGMSVTPALLSPCICKQLFYDIEDRFGRHWVDVLMEQREWTEYTLYYLTAERHRMLDQFHVVPTGGDHRLFCSSNVWKQGDFESWSAAACFKQDEPGLFTVINGKSGTSPRKLRIKLQRHLKVRRPSWDVALLRTYWLLRPSGRWRNLIS